MSDPVGQDDRGSMPEAGAERQPWQPLGYEKIAASDAQAAVPTPGTFDLTTYS